LRSLPLSITLFGVDAKEATLTDTIPPDSTIADVAETLRNPVEYVRKVLENFMASGLDREKAVVRIGVAGHGVAPHYKIEYPTELPFEDTLTIPYQATSKSTTVKAISG
jgi:hypothetical protein